MANKKICDMCKAETDKVEHPEWATVRFEIWKGMSDLASRPDISKDFDLCPACHGGTSSRWDFRHLINKLLRRKP